MAAHRGGSTQYHSGTVPFADERLFNQSLHSEDHTGKNTLALVKTEKIFPVFGEAECLCVDNTLDFFRTEKELLTVLFLIRESAGFTL